MKIFRKLYHFLGSIQLAIILITATAAFVIFGTLLESVTESHLYAASYIYSSPLFAILLWGFFINIFFSTIRRWPFKARHIPFLITHLGLLMILGGSLVKSYSGTQGSMGITEGSGSSEIFIPNTYVIQIEKQDPLNPLKNFTASYALTRDLMGNMHLTPPAVKEFSDLRLRLVHYTPHSLERMETWVKGNKGVIAGIQPFNVYDDPLLSENLVVPISAQVAFPEEPDQLWNVVALKTHDPEKMILETYLDGLEIMISDTKTGAVLCQSPLKNALQAPVHWNEGQASAAIDFNYSTVLGFDGPSLIIDVKTDNPLHERIRVPLDGPNALINQNLLTPFFGKPSVTIDLRRKETLVWLQDLQDDLYFFALSPFGQIYGEAFQNGNLNSLIVYDRGFGGYYVRANIPSLLFSFNRQDRERADIAYIAKQLNEGLKSKLLFSPPLEAWKKAVQKTPYDFTDTFLTFLQLWDTHQGWIFPLEASLPAPLKEIIDLIDWQTIHDSKTCFWGNSLLSELETQIKEGKDLIQILKERKWPLLDNLTAVRKETGRCAPEEISTLLSNLLQQVLAVADQLPPPSQSIEKQPAQEKARLFSTYLRLYGIHLEQIIPPADLQQREDRLKDSSSTLLKEHTCIECPITLKHRAIPPLSKWEDNLPSILLELHHLGKKEYIALSYNRFGTGLRWPVLDGQFLLRFQPKFESIPYRIRLRDARQINYPGTGQPYSFESDIYVTDLSDGKSIKKTISMNNVHETWDGHRFYLASLSPPLENSVQRVQIVVNHDPGKYILTYPGAIILSLGIVLLFWFRGKKRDSNRA